MVVISILLGSPGKRHPVLGQALACLFGSFQHLLSSLHTQTQTTHKINMERTANKVDFHSMICQQTPVCVPILCVRGPCLYQRSWCTARRSAWCHSATPSRCGPPGRYLHEGWSLRRLPAGRNGKSEEDNKAGWCILSYSLSEEVTRFGKKKLFPTFCYTFIFVWSLSTQSKINLLFLD